MQEECERVESSQSIFLSREDPPAKPAGLVPRETCACVYCIVLLEMGNWLNKLQSRSYGIFFLVSMILFIGRLDAAGLLLGM